MMPEEQIECLFIYLQKTVHTHILNHKLDINILTIRDDFL